MGGRPFGSSEIKAAKAVVRNYKENCIDWETVKRDPRKAAYFKELALSMEGRTEKSVEDLFHLVLGTRQARVPGHASRRGTIRRGARKYTAEGLNALKQNGKKSWDRIKDNFRRLGLSDHQIDRALSGKAPKVGQRDVEQVEATVALRGHCLVNFVLDPTTNEIQAEYPPLAEKVAGYEVLDHREAAAV